jgi:hypothetical protein
MVPDVFQFDVYPRGRSVVVVQPPVLRARSARDVHYASELTKKKGIVEVETLPPGLSGFVPKYREHLSRFALRATRYGTI